MKGLITPRIVLHFYSWSS